MEPVQLIEVKGLQGDTSDNIPGVPGIGEKTAISLIKTYGSIDKLYEELEEGKAETVKGKTRKKLIDNKELAYLSKTLGTINLDVPIEESINDLVVKEWNKQKVYEDFKRLKFNRYMERFRLKDEGTAVQNTEEKESIKKINIEEINEEELKKLLKKIQKEKKFTYFFTKEKCENEGRIINKKITAISILFNDNVYYSKINNIQILKEIFEDKDTKKISYKLGEDYVLLKENNITIQNIFFDIKIAAYLLNPTVNKYELNDLVEQYIGVNLDDYLKEKGFSSDSVQKQMNLFETNIEQDKKETEKIKNGTTVYFFEKLEDILLKKLEETNELDLFNNIEMPIVEVLSKMQYNGMYLDKKELSNFGQELKNQILDLTNQIYELAGEEFNINSTQQLGNILFEKLGLTASKKNKKGYSTDVDTLEKIKNEHPIIEKILEYRTLVKLNSTYVEGMLPYINAKTGRIHSYFHQTITSTGRLSSSEPNLQNIPTRYELGKKLRRVFKPKDGYIFIDADYSQIELRVLAHISQDKNMIEAFKNGEDIHKQAASKVLNIPIDEVTKEQRSHAKAVNFGIVYGISDFGLSEQLGVSVKKAKEYINQYLEKYNGIQNFMNDIVEKAKEKGYVETLFHRRRYLPELKSNNYVVRQFGARAAMNTPIQGTAADIMKIAMINLNRKIENKKIDAKIVLQVHDELILEVSNKDKDEANKILKDSMENAIKLTIPLEVQISEATNWYDCK